MIKSSIVKNLYSMMGQPIHRIILGNPMRGELSEVDLMDREVSGTIGFMDFSINPERILSSQDSMAFVVWNLGIELPYQGNGNYKRLVRLSERLARLRGCEYLIRKNIVNPAVRYWDLKNGYSPLTSCDTIKKLK